MRGVLCSLREQDEAGSSSYDFFIEKTFIIHFE